jgi:hypothetical protein
MNRRVVVLFATALILGLAAGGSLHPCRAQEPKSLTGQELQPKSDDPRSIFGEVLLGGGGKVEKVVVREDSERKLAVSIQVSKLNGRQIVGELLGSDRRRQKQFRTTPATVGADSTQAEIVFEPDETVPENTPVDSVYLRLRVQRADLPVPELDRTYKLNKRWLLSIPPERQVVRITPRAVGTAAQLKEQQIIVRPPVQVLQMQEVKPIAIARPRRPLPPAAMEIRAERLEAAPQFRAEMIAKAPIVAETKPAVEALPVDRKLVALERFRFGVIQEDKNRGAQGPGTSRLDLLEGLRSDPPVARESVLSVAREVFQDKNAGSGIFYFLPQDYHLRWDADEGYGLKMLYSAASGEGQAGNVMMAARLDAGVDTGAITLAEELLRAFSARHPETKFTALRPLPIDAPPAISLSGGLEHQYDIPADKIATHAISDALGRIDVSWVTDAVTKQNLQLALVEDVGINGNLTLTPSGGEMPARSLPVAIQIADTGTFGELRWRRGEIWRNRTAYPVRLKFLRALLLDNNEPIIYSWDLGGAEIQPRAQADIDGAPIPSWLDGRAKRVWIEYAVARDCRSCDEQVVAAITGGVTSLGSSQITFHTITPLEDTGAYEIQITVRSKYFDPRVRDLQVKPALVLGADNKDFMTGPVYLVNRQPGQAVQGDPLFEYQVALAMPSGETLTSDRWMPSDSLRVLIGKVQLEKALGTLPGGGGQ